MGRFVWFLCGLIVTGIASAQTIIPTNYQHWYTATSGTEFTAILDNVRTLYGLSTDHEFQLIENESFDANTQVQVYQQLYRGIPVDGGIIRIINTPSSTRVNTNIISDISDTRNATISQETALDLAMSLHPARRYAWEDAVAESVLQRAAGKLASHAPVPELVWFSTDLSMHSTSIRLAWRVEIFSLDPLQKTVYYLDAYTGETLLTFDNLCTSGVEGVAETRYHGTQSFMTDSLAPESYRLRDYTRGQGIDTYDLNKTSFLSLAVDFTDTDNVWNTANADQDEVANDIHWGAQMSYDYYLSHHGLDSYDGNGAPIISYAHMGYKYINAFWAGSYMAFGDADSSSGYYPLTTIDVVSHELTHGVTQRSSNLVYRNESGALNESFSDIFGKAVEYYNDRAQFNWGVASHAVPTRGGIRNMANPKKHNNPHTYKGQHWESGSFDNGGVHINSGVQNKWFQLLVEGGSGTNDNGFSYQLDSIGWQKAEAIAFRNLQVYLSRNSQFIDARMGSLLAAEDLYGTCSPEWIAVAKAWDAVGVGLPYAEFDLALQSVILPSSSCALGAAEPVSVRVYNNSCISTLPAGQTLPLAMTLNGGAIVFDTVTLQNDLPPNRNTTLLLNATLDLSAEQRHEVKLWVTSAGDTITINDTLTASTTHREWQNTDVGIDRILGPANACFQPDPVPVSVRLKFFGCDSLAAGTRIPVVIVNNKQDTFTAELVTDKTLFNNETTDLSTGAILDVSRFGYYNLEVFTQFAGDMNPGNDLAGGYRVQTAYPYQYGDMVTFRHINFSKDSLYISAGSRGEARVDPRAGNVGGFGLLLSGTTVAPRAFYQFPDSANVWTVNNNSRTSGCFCVDATNSSTFSVTFDLRQTKTDIHEILAGQDLPYSSNMRVLVDGQQITPTFLAKTMDSDPFETYTLTLDTMAGRQFELCFESRNLSSRTGDILRNIGDNTYIDNVRFGDAGNNVGITTAVMLQAALFPNPANQSALLVMPAIDNSVRFTVVDVTGRIILQGNATGEQTAISTASWSSGLYYVLLEAEGVRQHLPLMVTH